MDIGPRPATAGANPGFCALHRRNGAGNVPGPIPGSIGASRTRRAVRAAGHFSPTGARGLNDVTLFETRDGIAHFVFNRPQARNALTFEMYEHLREACEQADADRSIKRC